MREIFTDVSDFISGQELEFYQPNFGIHGSYGHGGEEYYKVRGIVKEGLSSFDTGYELGAIATNGATTYDPSGVVSCGETVTMFIYDLDFYNASLLLSQLDVLLDPLPVSCRIEDFYPTENSPFINNENFTAPEGVFSNPDQGIFELYNNSIFRYSTFSVGPRVFSDYAMKQFSSFGLESLGGYTDHPSNPVFQDCPNLEHIEQQGEFGDNLQSLTTIDFTYKDGDISRIDAYPHGGSPKIINGWVYGERISFSDIFPVIDSSRLEVCINHFDAGEIVIDGQAPQLPFGGIDFSKSSRLKVLELPLTKWVVDLPYALPNKLNFSFSWGTLGITAPPSCSVVSGLHCIYQNFGEAHNDTYILTPSRLKEGVHSGWGGALETFLEGEPGLTDDLMPLVPLGLDVVVDYYRKVWIGDEDGVWGAPKMGSLAMKPFLDNENRFYVVQELNMTGTGDRRNVVNYCTNLYSDLQIEFDIVVPPLPGGLFYSMNAYHRLFYNAVGKEEPAELDIEPVLSVFWSESSSSKSSTSTAYFIPNLTKSGDQYIFRNYFERAYGHEDPILMDQLVARGSLDSQYYPQYWTKGAPISFDYLDDFIDYAIGKVENVGFTSVRIESDIVLEKIVGAPPVYSYSFQKECFYGASINPEEVDALIDVGTATILDTNSYQGVLNIFIGYSSMPASLAWSPVTNSPTAGAGKVLIDTETFNTDLRYFSFIFTLTWGGGGDPEALEDYQYTLDDILWSGGARSESSSVKDPYYGAISDHTIKGNVEDFLNDKNIQLYNDSYFIAKTESIDADGSFVGAPVGFNVYQQDTGEDDDLKYLWRFVVSYNKTINIGVGVDNEFFGNIDFYRYYKPPAYYNDGEWDGKSGWVTGDSLLRQDDETQYRNNFNPPPVESWGDDIISE